MASDIDIEAERAWISALVHNSIGWAMDKDKDLLFSSVAQDSNFFIFHPGTAGTIVGFDAFKKMVELIFINGAFKATGFTVRNLRITISKSNDVAWYSAILDDHGEWEGQPTSWIDTRWTGFLRNATAPR